ncbi:hypothetical protein [Arthrobacter sp. CP30]
MCAHRPRPVGLFVIIVVVYGAVHGTRRTLGQGLFGLRTVRTTTLDASGRGDAAGTCSAPLLVPGAPLLDIGPILSANSYTVIDGRGRLAVVRPR